MNVLQVLTAARERISTPEKWCKGRFTTADGLRCCAAGALRAEGADCTSAPYEALYVAAGVERGQLVCNWNDAPERTHAEVLAAFDRAISTARGEGK